MLVFDTSVWISRLTGQRCASNFLSSDITKWPECKMPWCRCTTTMNPVSPDYRQKTDYCIMETSTLNAVATFCPPCLSHSQKSNKSVQLRCPCQEQLLLLLWCGLRSLQLWNVPHHFLLSVLSLCLQGRLLCPLHAARSHTFFHCCLT